MTKFSGTPGSRAAELTVLLADAPTDATDHERVRKYVHALAEAGLAVLFVYPGSKAPADMRTPQKRRADDKAAQQAAFDAGRRDWAKVRSAAGLALATTDADTLDRYLDRYVGLFSTWADADGNEVKWSAKTAERLTMVEPVAVNLAVEVGESGLVVIDCDTAAQMAKFLAEAEADPGTPPTVRSPGQRGPDGDPDDPGTWAHADGGHFWFAVPEGVELPRSPADPGAMTWPGDDGFAVLWDRRYVLIPPSVRPEGSYTAPGAVYALPGWLGEAITDHAAARDRRIRDRAAQPADSARAARIDAWAEGIAWGEILEPLGWYRAARPDGCGCEVWSAPGVHASPKSATAHDTGCSAGLYTEVNAPMHIWTDNPGEPFAAWIAERQTSTLSKLQAVAAGYYDNDEGAAMADLDLTDSDGLALGDDAAEFLDGYGKDQAEPSGGDGPSPPSPPGGTATSDPTAQAVAEAKAKVAAALSAADEMFDHSDVLKHIAAWADARGSSRVAALVQVLMQTALAIPPCVVIPAHLGGDHVGLTMLAAVTGEPSGGKGRAEAVGRDAIILTSGGQPRHFATMMPATGQGLVSMFAETEKSSLTGLIVTRIHTPAVMLSFKDIEMFGALVANSGNNLPAALLSLYMGDHLGGFTREGARRILLPAHTVVGCLSAGVQPSMGGVLLSPAMQRGGIPHRFVWTPVRNGRKTQRGSALAPMTVELPDLGVSADPFNVDLVYAPGAKVDVSDLVQIDVASSVAAEIHAADEAKDLDVFGAVPDGCNQLLGHTMLTRTKVAFLLGVLHGETGVRERWWKLAGLVMAVSEATMDAVAVASGAAEVIEERRVGERLGHRFVASDRVRDDAKVRDVADRLYARVGDDWTPVNGKAVITASKHGLIGDAWRLLANTGKVEAREHEYQPGKTTWQYRRKRG
jgi:hypothetical protein